MVLLPTVLTHKLGALRLRDLMIAPQVSAYSLDACDIYEPPGDILYIFKIYLYFGLVSFQDQTLKHLNFNPSSRLSIERPNLLNMSYAAKLPIAGLKFEPPQGES